MIAKLEGQSNCIRSTVVKQEIYLTPFLSNILYVNSVIFMDVALYSNISHDRLRTNCLIFVFSNWIVLLSLHVNCPRLKYVPACMLHVCYRSGYQWLAFITLDITLEIYAAVRSQELFAFYFTMLLIFFCS